MQVKVYWVDGLDSGRLGIMPRPRGGDWLEDEVLSLRESGVDIIISLLEREEVLELDLGQEQALCEAHGLAYLSFPIPDVAVPPSNEDTLSFVQMLTAHLSQGKSLVIHCRQGIGRSTVIAASVLALSGAPVETAFGQLAIARGRSVPDTQEQRDWVIRFAESHKRG